jgi:hypothetical protein
MLHHARADIVSAVRQSDDLFRLVHRLTGTLDLDNVRWAAECLYHLRRSNVAVAAAAASAAAATAAAAGRRLSVPRILRSRAGSSQ